MERQVEHSSSLSYFLVYCPPFALENLEVNDLAMSGDPTHANNITCGCKGEGDDRVRDGSLPCSTLNADNESMPLRDHLTTSVSQWVLSRVARKKTQACGTVSSGPSRN